MPKRSSKDPNVTAFSIMQEATGQKESLPEGVSKALDDAETRKQLMREMGRRGGRKGGKVRAARLSKKERSEIAKKAAMRRWEKKPKVN